MKRKRKAPGEVSPGPLRCKGQHRTVSVRPKAWDDAARTTLPQGGRAPRGDPLRLHGRKLPAGCSFFVLLSDALRLLPDSLHRRKLLAGCRFLFRQPTRCVFRGWPLLVCKPPAARSVRPPPIRGAFPKRGRSPSLAVSRGFQRGKLGIPLWCPSLSLHFLLDKQEKVKNQSFTKKRTICSLFFHAKEK